MNKIRFSVLMSVYKNDLPENFELAVNSLLNQSLVPNQIVIMVDGPITNELKKCLNKYSKNTLFDIYYRNENKGLGITLNEGLLKCKYDYVARMDADDESSLDRFQKQIDFLENNPEVDCVGSNMLEYDEDMEHVISQKLVPKTNEEIKEYIKTRNPMNHPTVIYRKEKVLEVNSYEDYPFFEDYYLWAKMIKNGSVFYNIQDNLYKFRAGSSMIKRRGGRKYLKSIKKLESGLKSLNIINRRTYFLNIIKRYFFALMPNKIREILYKIFLRKKAIKENI